MKNSRFGKIALIAFMILAAGAVFATPVSAGQTVKQVGPYDVYAIGEWTNPTLDGLRGLGKAEEVNGNRADWLTIEVDISKLPSSVGPWSSTLYNAWTISNGWHSYLGQNERQKHVITTTFSSSTGQHDESRYTLRP